MLPLKLSGAKYIIIINEILIHFLIIILILIISLTSVSPQQRGISDAPRPSTILKHPPVFKTVRCREENPGNSVAENIILFRNTLYRCFIKNKSPNKSVAWAAGLLRM